MYGYKLFHKDSRCLHIFLDSWRGQQVRHFWHHAHCDLSNEIYFVLIEVVFSTSSVALTSKHFSGEATVLDFDWKPVEEIPVDIIQSRSLKNRKKSFAADPRGWAEFDLDGSDRTCDVIIDEWNFPSGGRAFLLLRKTRLNMARVGCVSRCANFQ